jgi:DNA repair photolyase
MPRPAPTFNEALALVERLDQKYRPAWDAFSPEEQAALALYFLPHNSARPVVEPTRPRMLKWYCPFADQASFPSGHRYCINVYTGCAHECAYCYAASYSPASASPKQGFERLVLKDMEDLKRFGVPPAPIHLSNSTDPFQPLENEYKHTRFALEQILQHRQRFTTVTILTKDPLRSVKLGYVDLFRQLGSLPNVHPRRAAFDQGNLPGFVVEVSLAFWREEARRQYDPCAPSIAARKEGLHALRDAGIPVVLRIDPLFPPARSNGSHEDLGLIEPQSRDDLEQLVALAKGLSVRHVVFSAAKITKPRGQKLSGTMLAVRDIYRACAFPRKLDFHGGSWRLPGSVAQDLIVRPFLDICTRYAVQAKHCKQNLIGTP